MSKGEYRWNGFFFGKEKMTNRESVLSSAPEKKLVAVIEDQNDEFKQQAISPIICEGDVIGAVIMMDAENKMKMGEVEKKLVQSAAAFLGRQMEQ